MSDPELPPEYLTEHVRQAITTDARTSEQGIEVRLVHGALHLSGDVGSVDRRDAVAAVAAEAAGDHPVRNDVRVVEPGQHHTTERIT